MLDGISDKTNENNNYENVTNNTSRADNISLHTCPENSKGRKGKKNMLVKMSSFHSGRGGGPSSAIMITAKSPIKPTLETNIMLPEVERCADEAWCQEHLEKSAKISHYYNNLIKKILNPLLSISVYLLLIGIVITQWIQAYKKIPDREKLAVFDNQSSSRKIENQSHSISSVIIPLYSLDNKNLINIIIQTHWYQPMLQLATFILMINLTIPPHYKAALQIFPCIFFIFIQSFLASKTENLRDTSNKELIEKFGNEIIEQNNNSSFDSDTKIFVTTDYPIMNNYIILTCFLTTIIFFFFNRERDKTIRLHHIVMHQSVVERANGYKQAKNARLALEDILPTELVQAYISCNLTIDHEKRAFRKDVLNAGVGFAKIVNFDDFYNEIEENGDGKECLRILNELIADFDKIILLPAFKNDLVKIKTIGSTYMVASGLNDKCNNNNFGTFDPNYERQNSNNNENSYDQYSHLRKIADYLLRIQTQLEFDNIHLMNDFKMRIGLNCGNLISGAIGQERPHHDIWGDTVNCASRMESTGCIDKIQVTESTALILMGLGYNLEKRPGGPIFVKGKGMMQTYFLNGPRPNVKPIDY